jgi:ABC-type branched-subunit amino acid transport system substrate-binding protein
VIAKLPDNVDAIYLGMGGTDSINFLNQYQQAGGKANLIGGSIMADPTVLSSKGKAKDALVGTPTSGPFANDNPAPEWQAYVKAYQDGFPADKRLPSPSLFGLGYQWRAGHDRRVERGQWRPAAARRVPPRC